jgi:putative hydrolase of the HAD superfamily
MTRFRALIFDLDDTLYPERQYVFSGFRAVSQWCSKRFGYPADETFDQLVGIYLNGSRKDTFQRWFEERDIESVTNTPLAIEIYREHYPAISCFTGVAELLKRLKSRARLGLVSDGALEVQQRKLEALGIAGSFDAIVLSDTWGKDYWKPHPRPFQTVLDSLGVKAHEAVYVADNPLKDFVGAKPLGMWTVQVLSRDAVYASEEPPSPKHAPDMTIHSILEIESLL